MARLFPHKTLERTHSRLEESQDAVPGFYVLLPRIREKSRHSGAFRESCKKENIAREVR